MKTVKKKQTIKKAKSSKMTLDKLATIIKSELDKKVSKEDLREELKNFVTKDDLKKEFANFKVEIKEELLGGIDDLLTRADKVLSKFDKSSQEEVAHNQSHKRIDETLNLHDQRIKNLETAKA